MTTTNNEAMTTQRETQTPEEAGADDLDSWLSDQTINNPTADQTNLAAEILAKRGRGYHEPDEALINAMGRGWILEQCGVENTDENWESVGLAWCKRYNAGYWAAAEIVASQAG